jgi:hypothetical protein
MSPSVGSANSNYDPGDAAHKASDDKILKEGFEFIGTLGKIRVVLDSALTNTRIEALKSQKESFVKQRNELLQEQKALMKAIMQDLKTKKALPPEKMEKLKLFEKKTAAFNKALMEEWEKDNPEAAKKENDAIRESLNIFEINPKNKTDLNKL